MLLVFIAVLGAMRAAQPAQAVARARPTRQGSVVGVGRAVATENGTSSRGGRGVAGDQDIMRFSLADTFSP
jgi:hypothetical protein